MDAAGSVRLQLLPLPGIEGRGPVLRQAVGLTDPGGHSCGNPGLALGLPGRRGWCGPFSGALGHETLQ